MGARRALQAGGHPSCIPPAPPATHMPPPRPQTMHCRSPELPDDSRQWVPNRADARAFDVCILTATGCILRSRSAAHVKPRAQIMSSPLTSDAKAQICTDSVWARGRAFRGARGFVGWRDPGGKRSRAAVNFQPTQPEVAGRLPMAAMRCCPHASGVSKIHRGFRKSTRFVTKCGRSTDRIRGF